MGQPQSSEESKRQDPQQTTREERVPYTQYSLTKSTNERLSPPTPVRGITVVNPRSGSDLRGAQPLELQKLEKIHRFWPILKSSIQYTQPIDKVADGLEYRDVLAMCTRYQEHLQDTAIVVSNEQRSLTSRLRDLEMFSAGITQQIVRRQERMQRALAQLEKVQEVCSTLDEIHSSLEQCVPLLQRLNQLLPERERLEPFKLHPTPNPAEEVDGDGDGDGVGEKGGAQVQPGEEGVEGQREGEVDEHLRDS